MPPIELAFDINNVSLKMIKRGTGSVATPATTNHTATVTIPHGFGTDKLLWQVGIKDGHFGTTYYTPANSPNGTLGLNAELDSTNLYIIIRLSSASATLPARTWTYTYRLLLP